MEMKKEFSPLADSFVLSQSQINTRKQMENKNPSAYLFLFLRKERSMKKETNLNQVKDLAKTFLMLDIAETKMSPLIVKHPFKC